MRVGSATVGTTSIEHIRWSSSSASRWLRAAVEPVGSEAMGGVVQIFTRGKPCRTSSSRRRSAAIATARRRRLTTIDKGTAAVMTTGYREVDAPSATTERVPFCHDPDRDPYDVAYANLRVAQQLWQGETVALEAFGTRSRTHFDGCGTDDRNEQVIAGVRVTSSARFARTGAAASRSRTAATSSRSSAVSRPVRDTPGAGLVDQRLHGDGRLDRGRGRGAAADVESDSTTFAQDERTTKSFLRGLNQSWAASARGELAARRRRPVRPARHRLGGIWLRLARVAARLAPRSRTRLPRADVLRSLRPASDFYQPNPDAQARAEQEPRVLPARARDLEDPVARDLLRQPHRGPHRLRVPHGAEREPRAHQGRGGGRGRHHWGIKWKASVTFQEPRDEDTGKRLHGRADRFGTSRPRALGFVDRGLTVHASGDRYDSPDEREGTRLPGYATADARVRYTIAKHWTAELTAPTSPTSATRRRSATRARGAG
jgi:hypothetical protein